MTENQLLKEQVIEAIDKNSDDLIELCAKLIQTPSENPPGDSTEITAFVKEYLEANGLSVDIHESNDNMYNIISSYGNEEGKSLIYCGHTDVVPVGS